jgi:hypothetical protein
MTYCQLTDVTALLNRTFDDASTPSRSQVTDFIGRADSFIDTFCGHDWQSHASTLEYYDGTGYGPRAGLIVLKNTPVLSLSKVEYYDGQTWQTCVQGKPNDYPTQQTYEFYQDEAKIKFYKLRLDAPQIYRVTYTYGYSSVPTYVKDLSATLTGLAVVAFLSGPALASYFVGDLRVQYPADGAYGLQWKFLADRANRLMWQLSTRRPLVSVG